MKALENLRAAVMNFRRQEQDTPEQQAAAFVAADACEEAGLRVDAAWYRWTASGEHDRVNEPPRGKPQVWGTPRDQLDEILEQLASDQSGEE